jgi:hypothetical protein
MADVNDYIKAAKEKGLSDKYIIDSKRIIDQIEKEGNYINWQWYISMLPEAFDE